MQSSLQARYTSGFARLLLWISAWLVLALGEIEARAPGCGRFDCAAGNDETGPSEPTMAPAAENRSQSSRLLVTLAQILLTDPRALPL